MNRTAAQDQRAAVRFDTAMPLEIEGSPGETRNVSTHGVYFEADVPQELGGFVSPGALVNFTVEFQAQGRRHRLLCEGKVVRVEQHEGRVGVAARLVAPLFEETEEVTL